MRDRHAADWEELARREPYFAVLTHEGYLGVESNSVATAAFFESGEADLAALLEAIPAITGRAPRLESALDFGCGVGRLTLPLARRASRVIACDVAPTMLEHARKNAAAAGLGNVTFIEGNALAAVPQASLDFVCSLLVLQHIPPAVGYERIATLVRLLAPGGIAALHVTLERPGGSLRRLARSLRARSRIVHRVAGLVRGDRRGLPYMQMNEYDRHVIDRTLDAAGVRLAGHFPTRHGDTSGAVLIIENPVPPA
jgi:SAM-dependent methyltransferase